MNNKTKIIPPIGLGEIKFTLNPKDINLKDYVSDIIYVNLYHQKGFKSKEIFQSYKSLKDERTSSKHTICYTNYHIDRGVTKSVQITSEFAIYVFQYAGYFIDNDVDFIVFVNQDRHCFEVYNINNTYLFSYRGDRRTCFLVFEIQSREELKKFKMKMLLEGKLV